MLRRLCEKPTRSVFSPMAKRIFVCTHAHAGRLRMRVEVGADLPQCPDIGKALEAWDEGKNTIKILALLQ